MKKLLKKKDISNIFNSFKKFTKSDAKKVMENMDKILQIASNDNLKKFINDIKLYFEMLSDFFTGKYKKIPYGTIAAIIGTLLYVLIPTDLLPDFIPGIGYLDDAAVLVLCLKFTLTDVENYKREQCNLRIWKLIFSTLIKYSLILNQS